MTSEFNRLERQLNESCVLYELNVGRIYMKVVQDKKIKSGVFIDQYHGIMENIKAEDIDLEIGHQAIFISQDHETAFFIHHEGWIWVCSEKNR